MPDRKKKILLMGNPNVGKSAIFSRMTGARVTISNYPGTTIGFTQGNLRLSDEEAVLIDVPGIYNLKPASRADEVAVDMLGEGDMVINVVDATNLERNLYLSLELRERGIPMMIVLNMWDETRHKGIEIDVKELERELGVPVVTACGLTGEGIRELMLRLPELGKGPEPLPVREDKWSELGRIVASCQTLHHHDHTFLESIEDLTTHPATGMPIAGLVIYVSFVIVRGIGEGLIQYVFDPLFEKLWRPAMSFLSSFLGSGGFIHNILVGQLINGEIDFTASFGLLTTGFYVPIAAVFPYIIGFYLVLSVLEDLGYLPRLATQVDNLMHRLGLHGYAIVPFILGLGCNVPGAMALRLLENRREKFIAATLMAIAVPCMAQIAMIIGVVGERGGEYVALIFGILLTLLISKGIIMNRFMKGSSPEILWEIPPYRLPSMRAIVKKLGYRVRSFLKEAVPMVLAGVLVVNVLYMAGVIDMLAGIFAPVLSGLWGLPPETIPSLLIGFLRKDVAVGMLEPLDLTTKQLVISSTILAIYFPCAATFIIMVRELGAKDMLRAAVIMVFTTIIVGTLLNLLLWF